MAKIPISAKASPPRFRGLLVAFLGSTLLTLASPSHAASPAEIQTQIEQIAGKPIATASAADIIRAIDVLIKREPKLATEIIITLGKAGRKDDHCEISQFVRAAILALGRDSSRSIVLNLVQKAVVASPRCAPAIASAAILVSPINLADDIVEAAVAALPDPTIKIGELTAAEAIAQAGITALAALQAPGQLPPVAAGPDGGGTPDAAALFTAANRGFQTSLAALFGGALNPPANQDFKAVNNVIPVNTEPPAPSQ